MICITACAALAPAQFPHAGQHIGRAVPIAAASLMPSWAPTHSQHCTGFQAHEADLRQCASCTCSSLSAAWCPAHAACSTHLPPQSPSSCTSPGSGTSAWRPSAAAACEQGSSHEASTGRRLARSCDSFYGGRGLAAPPGGCQLRRPARRHSCECCLAQARVQHVMPYGRPFFSPEAHFWPSTGVRSITATHASGALQIGRFQQSWFKQLDA